MNDLAILSQVPKRLGIYRQVKSNSNLTATEIVRRILENRQRYLERNRKKEAQERKLLEQEKKNTV